MNVNQQTMTSSKETEHFWLQPFTSKNDFESKYRSVYYNNIKGKALYHQILTEVTKTISEDNVDGFKHLCNCIDNISDIESQTLLGDYHDDPGNPIRGTNLIIFACKLNKEEILKYLLSCESKILNRLSICIGKEAIGPENEDETCCNAFHYAMCCGNVHLLDMLISKWPNDYFATHLAELEDVLSTSYDKLKLKNALLSDDIQIFVENKLISLRFFSDTTGHVHKVPTGFTTIRKRMEFVIENIYMLEKDFENVKDVGDKFIFIAKSIVQNIHILKQQLKSTYDRLPWEEIEFCLISFVSSLKKQQVMNLLYYASLTKERLLSHIGNFARRLEQEKGVIESMDANKLSELPKLKRGEVVAQIIKHCPQLEELYQDYQQIRDIYSLEKVKEYIKLVSEADPEEREGQLIIWRTLQIIGEYFKNTLISPNLSQTSSELLLLSLSDDTRDAIDLSNTLSHASSLTKRAEIDQNTNVNFFSDVQGDLKEMKEEIIDVIFDKKINTIKTLLKKVANCKDLEEIRDVARCFSSIQLKEMFSRASIMTQYNKLEMIIEEFSDIIIEKTSYEKELFTRIEDIMKLVEGNTEHNMSEYLTSLTYLKCFNLVSRKRKSDESVLREMKTTANKALEKLVPDIEPQNIKKITEVLAKILQSVALREHPFIICELEKLMSEMFYIAERVEDDTKWIEGLRGMLNERNSFVNAPKAAETESLTAEECNTHLLLKVTELRNILSNIASSKTTGKFTLYKANKKLQAAVEMLVLDITSILGSSNYLENNLFFLDDCTPLLMGRSLCNYLAHDNGLVDILSSDPLMAVLLNAIKLAEEGIPESTKRIGKYLRDNPSKVKEKFHQHLITVTNQERLYVALEEGNLEDLNTCLSAGADLNGRSLHSWTALHFAAKGQNLQMVEFVLNRKLYVNSKDIYGQNPLHIAAAYGRTTTVKFLLGDVDVNCADKYNKTPLHLASENGHKDTVEVLLEHKASTILKDKSCHSAFHYAIRNNHKEIVDMMLATGINVDHNEFGGFTSLHTAVERGHLEIVKLIIEKGANVNARTDKGTTVLHLAVFDANTELVKMLIEKGADVRARVYDGCTALHIAAHEGYEEIASILLEHGALVNVTHAVDKTTPLMHAAQKGHSGIVGLLLQHRANINVVDLEGATALHYAASGGYLEVADILLKHGANANAKDDNYTTPLHAAVDGGHEEIVKLLIKNKSRVNTRANDDMTPLHMAARHGHRGVVEILIENKARVHSQNTFGGTPLHTAASVGSVEVMEVLIKNKAYINRKTYNGLTALQYAALGGFKDAVALLLKNKADVNTKGEFGVTPLQAAVIGGHEDIVRLLIESRAKVNTKGIGNCTALYIAAESGFKEIVSLLIRNGANVNLKCNSSTAFFAAVKFNHKEIVEILLGNGADVTKTGENALILAIDAGYRGIVEILLNTLRCVDVENTTQHASLLHLAVMRGHKHIVQTLIERGANIHSRTSNNLTPLHVAAKDGYEEIAEVLIANGADINATSTEGFRPLHVAAAFGHVDIVKVLLENGADVNVKDEKKRTPLDTAVACCYFEIVKMLCSKVNINNQDNDLSILHVAAELRNIEMVKYLIDEGADINARNAKGAKPIHSAAKEGHVEAVELFLNLGLSINDLGAEDRTLMHYAAMQRNPEIIGYLVGKGADVNAQDTSGMYPIHFATILGHKEVVLSLLKHGALYNAADNVGNKPLDVAVDGEVERLLMSTERLFQAVKTNNVTQVGRCIKEGAFVDAKNTDSKTALYYAVWKGCDAVVNALLEKKADTNVVDGKGFTPLHYAAKFSHVKIVKALLSSGAVYNAASDSGKTPLDFTVDKDISNLFKLLNESFKNIKNGNSQVLNDLRKIKYDDLKPVMNALNIENRSLLFHALHSRYPRVRELKWIAQGDVSRDVDAALTLAAEGSYEMALGILKSLFERSKDMLGADNPCTLDLKSHIGDVLCNKGAFQEASCVYKEVYEKQKEILGVNDATTLRTRSFSAVILHRQGRNDEALSIYKEVGKKQKEILGSNHEDTVDTEFHMAMVLLNQGKFDEALQINKSVFDWKKRSLGSDHPNTLCALNNIAIIYAQQGKHVEALKAFKNVYEKRKITFGPNHPDTLRVLNRIAEVFVQQDKLQEALNAYEEILGIQKTILGPNHPDVLITQFNIGTTLFDQGKPISALKVYQKVLVKTKAVFGPTHPYVRKIETNIKVLDRKLMLEGNEQEEILNHLEMDIYTAAGDGDFYSVERLLKEGTSANGRDGSGRSPLHYGVNSGHISIVNILLKHGADVTRVTNKGNTPLHTAASNGHIIIVDILLRSVSRDKLKDFVDAKTFSGGATSLHIAAKNGFLDIVMSLLGHGATYNIKNRDGKTPLDLTKNIDVTNFFKLVADMFEDAERGNFAIIAKLKTKEPGEFTALTFARNCKGNTLVQVAISNKHILIANELLQILKERH